MLFYYINEPKSEVPGPKSKIRILSEYATIELIKKEKTVRKSPEKGVQAFFITNYDPRLMHPNNH